MKIETSNHQNPTVHRGMTEQIQPYQKRPKLGNVSVSKLQITTSLPYNPRKEDHQGRKCDFTAEEKYKSRPDGLQYIVEAESTFLGRAAK